MKLPKELSIPQIEPPSVAELLTQTALQSTHPNTPAEASQRLENEIGLMSKTMILITNQLWRIETVVNDPENGEIKTDLSSQEMRKIANALEAIKQSIGELGIRIKDRCNEDFHPGLPDQVVTEEPREGISKERIIRTIRPTILWNQTMVQRGEIDIAVPILKK
jgi:hypothetical protein